MEDSNSSSNTDDIVLESLAVSGEHSVIVLDSAEQEAAASLGGSAGDDDCVILEENFNCLRIPPLVVEERLPRCDTWEEFLEGVEKELVVVSRETKDRSEAFFGPGGSGRGADLNDNILVDVSPKKRKRKKEKYKKSKGKIWEKENEAGEKRKSKKQKSGERHKSGERSTSEERNKSVERNKSIERNVSKEGGEPKENIKSVEKTKQSRRDESVTSAEIGSTLAENYFANTQLENAQQLKQQISQNSEKVSDLEVSLSHQLAISSEDEDEDEENLTGEAAGEYWVRLATAGAPQDDEPGGEDHGAQDRVGGGEEDGNQACSAAEKEKKGSKEDDEISFECQENDLFSEEEDEIHAEQVKPLKDEEEVKEGVVRGQDTGYDVCSLGIKKISTIFSF